MSLNIECIVDFSKHKDIYIADFIRIKGFLYILDKFNHKIYVFNEDGDLIRTIGQQGKGPVELYYPSAIAHSKDGRVFVADSYNHRIQVITLDGHFLNSFGNYGTGKGEFSEPVDVAIDLENNLLVVDCNNHRVQKFTVDGEEILSFGEYGKGQGSFEYPISLAVDEQNNYYVVDVGNSRIQKFNSDGIYILGFGEKGEQENKIVKPSSVLRYKDYVYISDEIGRKILKFTKHGIFVKTFDQQAIGRIRLFNKEILAINKERQINILRDFEERSEREVVLSLNQNEVNENIRNEIAAKCAFEEKDYKDGLRYVNELERFAFYRDTESNFKILEYLFENKYYDKALSLIIPELKNRFPLSSFRSKHFDYLIEKRNLTNDSELVTLITKLVNERYIKLEFIIGKDGLGELNQPKKMAVDTDGNIFVTEHGSHCFQKFSCNGEPLMRVGHYGSKEGEFNSPSGICVSEEGNIFVSDYKNQRVQAFNKNGKFLFPIDYDLKGPDEVATDRMNRLIISDVKANQVKIFSPRGEYLGDWNMKKKNLTYAPFQFLFMKDHNVNWYVDNKGSRLIKEAVNGEVADFQGIEPDYFKHIYSVAVDRDNNIYVSDYGRIQKFNKNFDHIYTYRLNVSNPVSIKLWHDKLFVSDLYNNCIYCFRVRH